MFSRLDDVASHCFQTMIWVILLIPKEYQATTMDCELRKDLSESFAYFYYQVFLLGLFIALTCMHFAALFDYKMVDIVSWSLKNV